jgi:hypothetical protein
MVNILMARRHPAKRQRVADGAKILLDIAKESSDWCTPLKSVLGGVSALVKHYEVRIERMAVAHSLRECSQQFEDVKDKIEDLIPHLNRFKQHADTAVSDGDQAEKKRRSELFRYARRLLTTSASQRPSQRIGRDREEVARLTGKRRGGSVRGQRRGFRRGSKTCRTTSRGYYPLPSEREPVCCIEYSSRRRTDIATASDLRQSHQPHGKNSPICLSLLRGRLILLPSRLSMCS